jgi:hypothetical protein
MRREAPVRYPAPLNERQRVYYIHIEITITYRTCTSARGTCRQVWHRICGQAFPGSATCESLSTPVARKEAGGAHWYSVVNTTRFSGVTAEISD